MTQRRNPESSFIFICQFLNNNYLIVLSVTDSVHFFLVFSTKQINTPPQKKNNKAKIYEIDITSLVFLKSLFIVYLGYNPISFLRDFLYSSVTVSIIFLIQLAAEFLLLFIQYIKNRKKVQQGKVLGLLPCKSGASSPIPKIINICAVAYELPPAKKHMHILAINMLKMYKI